VGVDGSMHAVIHVRISVCMRIHTMSCSLLACCIGEWETDPVRHPVPNPAVHASDAQQQKEGNQRRNLLKCEPSHTHTHMHACMPPSPPRWLPAGPLLPLPEAHAGRACRPTPCWRAEPQSLHHRLQPLGPRRTGTCSEPLISLARAAVPRGGLVWPSSLTLTPRAAGTTTHEYIHDCPERCDVE